MKKISFLWVLLAQVFGVNAQFSLSGKVLSTEHEPLVGASVHVGGTSVGTITDINGVYKMDNLEKGDYLILISYMGYEKVEKKVRVDKNITLDVTLFNLSFMADEVVVKSTRLGEKSPGTSSLVTNEELNERNLGRDLPYLMSLTPSFVATSDAGVGVGYTGFRIRGTDANRVNVTVNGIPMNDAESHGVWWVNMPDFASSVENIQIQRGVGTSTNGSGAFGASINLQTNKLESEGYGEINSTAGSFNTFKNTVKVGSGLINEHFVLNARLSQISSDGFVDRASSNLKSYFVSGAYYAENKMLKVNVFSGKEKTYQAWWGVPKVRLKNDLGGMQRYENHGLYTPEETEYMINSDSRTYNYYTYDNETDNYQQDHYQMFFNHQFSKNMTFNSALHYTYGRGYYEQYRVDDDLADYGIADVITGMDTVISSDLIRQKWLDNDFYGMVTSVNYTNEKLDLTIGGAANRYDGRHFGNVIWGQIIGDVEKDYEYYRSTGTKTDANIYTKANYVLSNAINLYGDMQYRKIIHDINGIDDDGRDLTQKHNFDFINPKAGLHFNFSNNQEAFVFYAMGHREPNRSNFTDADEGEVPTFEALNDFEVGYKMNGSDFIMGANVYYMFYKDQLILTGEINDVGSVIMRNVDKSFRRGIELYGGVALFNLINWDVNATLSQNKIVDFVEYVDNWDTWGQDVFIYHETDIAFSPSIIANSILAVKPFKGFKAGITTQYVGKQYIDNSMNDDRALEAYLINNAQFSYSVGLPNITDLTFSLQANNLFNSQYETHAWVYSYYLGGSRYAMDGYFPQAGINFLAGVKLRF